MFNGRILSKILHKVRNFFYLLWSWLYNAKPEADTGVSIDVVIPAVETDLETLPLCIEGVRKNTAHHINEIFIVAPESRLLRDFAEQHGVSYVEETGLMGYSPADINFTVCTGLNRSGWIFQQLIKLSGKAGTSRYFLAVDADHVLLKPHVFLTRDMRHVFYQSGECNLPYYTCIRKLLNFYPFSMFSYVGHKMFFDKEELKRLHAAIEQENGQGWDKAIISKLDPGQIASFSEFELYGNFLEAGKKIHVPWKEKMLDRGSMSTLAVLQEKYRQFLSVTFPAYLPNKKTDQRF